MSIEFLRKAARPPPNGEADMRARDEALQADLDVWLVHYNTERPHLGYRNVGQRPVETVMSFVSQEG